MLCQMPCKRISRGGQKAFAWHLAQHRQPLRSAQPQPYPRRDALMESRPMISRRIALKGAGALALALGTVELAGRHAIAPQRMVLEASSLPDIQFDIGAFIAAPRNFNDGGGTITAQLPPVHTVFITATLNRAPTRADRTNLINALATIEATYPFRADGIITLLAYGIPYFNKLPGGLN